jgi:hypothetical protein
MSDLAALDEQRLRERAYELWKEAGAPSGQDQAFWHLAIEDIKAQEAKLDAELRGSFPASDASASSSVSSPSTNAALPNLP